MRVALGRERRPLVAGVSGVALTTAVYLALLDVRNAAIVSTSFLLIVLLVAASSTLAAAIVTSLVAMLCFNFFFLPPVRTFTIADPQNWVALFAFLVVSLVASNLSARARARAEEALARRAELARLYDLSRDVLQSEDSREGIVAVARPSRGVSISRSRPWRCPARTAPGTWYRRAPALSTATSGPVGGARRGAASDRVRRGGAHVRRAPPVAPRRTAACSWCRCASARVRSVCWPPRATTSMLARWMPLPDWRRWQSSAHSCSRSDASAALTRQSEALKTTLLASIGHDLRTPLTAIRVGIENLRSR